MTNEQAIKWLKDYIQNTPFQMEQYERAFDMAIQALSQESEIEENIIKYMKKYPNHVGNIDFWEGFYACRNVVLQLDDEECSPKEQEPCDDAVSRQAVLDEINRIGIKAFETYTDYSQLYDFVDTLPPVTQKSDEQLYKNGFADGYEQGHKDAEQKSGKWNEYYTSQKGNDVFNCKECGHTFVVTQGKDNMNYCPNCGAKMVEPQEKRCEDCNHYGKLSLDCARCDDDCSMYEPQESEE